MIFGARASLLAGVVSISIALGLGVPIGLLAGYGGRWIDALISRITDAMLAIPFLILAIALAAFLGPSLQNAMIAIGLTATPIFVRLTRGQVMAVKVEDYVEAARAVGNPALRIAFKHILPNIMPALIVQATISHRHRHHRRGEPVVPGARPAAAGAVVGLDAQHRPALPHQRAVDGHVAGTGDLPRRCCPSISWATACATRSTRRNAESRGHAFASRAPENRTAADVTATHAVTRNTAR